MSSNENEIIVAATKQLSINFLLYFLQAAELLKKLLDRDADNTTDSDTQKCLLAAAKQLSDATQSLLEAAKVATELFHLGIAATF